MKNISRKNRKTNGNVLSIADNPKFKPAGKMIPLPSSVPNVGRFGSFDLCANVFGFMRGDELVCRMDFNAENFGENTLVIAETASGNKLKPAAAVSVENILAVVVAFVREVKR
jgi:hypothetical protein